MSGNEGMVLRWFAALDDWLAKRDCPVAADTARAIAAKRLRHADSTGLNCHVTQATIADRLHIERPTVRIFDRFLMDNGWMVKTKEHGGKGGHGTIYQLTIPLDGSDADHSNTVIDGSDANYSTLDGRPNGRPNGSHGYHNLRPPTVRKEEGGSAAKAAATPQDTEAGGLLLKELRRLAPGVYTRNADLLAEIRRLVASSYTPEDLEVEFTDDGQRPWPKKVKSPTGLALKRLREMPDFDPDGNIIERKTAA